MTLGVVCLVLNMYLYWQRTNPQRLSFSGQKTPKIAAYSHAKNPAEYLIIKDLRIDLPIYPAVVRNQEWETTTLGVSHLSNSPIPGEPGNSVIYGHNWQNLLGQFVNIKPGQEITIEYKDRSRKTFIVDKTAVVEPDQVSILAPSEDTRITLYTCTGFLDSKRFVAVAIAK